jgi:nicotinic acid mononucleotide adenylyltransferase
MDLLEPVSASEIRAAVQGGSGASGGMLDARVAAYIEQHGLYREEAIS